MNSGQRAGPRAASIGFTGGPAFSRTESRTSPAAGPASPSGGTPAGRRLSSPAGAAPVGFRSNGDPPLVSGVRAARSSKGLGGEDAARLSTRASRSVADAGPAARRSSSGVDTRLSVNSRTSGDEFGPSCGVTAWGWGGASTPFDATGSVATDGRGGRASVAGASARRAVTEGSTVPTRRSAGGAVGPVARRSSRGLRAAGVCGRSNVRPASPDLAVAERRSSKRFGTAAGRPRSDNTGTVSARGRSNGLLTGSIGICLVSPAPGSTCMAARSPRTSRVGSTCRPAT